MIDGERRLATIRRIANLEPIEGADRIVKATIDGWELVTQKENYRVNDLCLYFEIDSFLPVREEFEFLRKGCFKSTTNLGDGFRIKTIKLRGQVSQGLSLPLSDFFRFEDGVWFYTVHDAGYFTKVVLEEGTDVTEYFGVQKYEKPLPKQGGANFGHSKGNFPSFIPKTDQERVQNCLASVKKWIYFQKSEVFEVTPEDSEWKTNLIVNLEAGRVENTADTQYFKSGDMWFQRHALQNESHVVDTRSVFEMTLKLDGSSMTVYHNDGTVGVCSRNLELKRDTENVFWKTAIRTKLLAALVQDGRNVAVQGELMGPGVQGNREKLPDHVFFVYNFYDIDEKRYLLPDEQNSFIESLGVDLDFHPKTVEDGYASLDFVPYIGKYVVDNDDTVADFLKVASRKSIGHDIAEGVVFKPFFENGPSFKIINNEYLLKEKD